ncbi:MAG: hypothetical protein D6812_05580 [Deltaproteobacteria bacterium]|nr:MAG: hypothetical protein D6812_05580 [Deltaproteobacteria bacterium]
MERDQQIAFRLPLPGWPRAVFESGYTFRGGRLLIEGEEVLRAATREELEAGLTATIEGIPAPVGVRLDTTENRRDLHVTVGGRPALRESDLSPPPTRSVWIHAWLALAASLFGFAASYLYLLEARATGDPWPLKMAIHMAGWHLLLLLTLFPVALWGQRHGIRVVQFVCLVFFAIHLGIALANLRDVSLIALFNALSGLSFLGATLYGNRAWREMDPIRALPAIEEVRP